MRRPNLFDAHADTLGRSHFETVASLLTFLWPRGYWNLKVRVAIAVACLIAAKVTNVYVPFLYKGAVDTLDSDAAIIAVPVAFVVAYGVARMFAQAFGELRDAAFAKVGQHAIRTVALATFNHLHALSLRFHLDRQTGGLSRVIERGTKAIEYILSFTLFNILPTLLEIFLVCGILLVRYDFWLALVTFVTIAGFISWTVGVTEWRIKYRREMNRTDSEANTKAIDSLINYETVKYFNNEAHEASRYDSALERYQTAAVLSKTSLSLLNIGQGAIISFGLVIVMILAGRGVADGSMTLGDFVLVNTFLIQLYLPLNFLGFVYREIKQSLVDMEKMFELTLIDPEVKDPPNAKPIVVNDGEVVFDHVSFGYDPRRPILKDVSFSVPPGKSLAIVGPTGAGKSTIARLLYRFYDISDGAIRIDGQDLREVAQGSLREVIGIVPQDTVLFNDSIAYNIRYGRPGSGDDGVRHAAAMAHISDLIDSLPDGFETVVGERGLKLSGGEKQRVAIARTILKDPKILIFDEATSALDSHTEKEIQANLSEVSQDRTTLAIAHRLSTVVDADEILVLDNGQISERGTHRVLLAKGGQYAAMWAKQQEAARRERELEALTTAE